jgi:hypothetical protein
VRQVFRPATGVAGNKATQEEEEEEDKWTNEFPPDLLLYTSDDEETTPPPSTYERERLGPAPPPPQLPAQLQRGVLNQAVLVQQGSGDDNSILPRPDHSVLDHLLASPINKGLLSVAVTKRYKRKVREREFLQV